jgi:hypothetical protein
MTILRERVKRTTPRDPTKTRRSSDLTPEEQANVRKALRVLRIRIGTNRQLAEAMGANLSTLRSAIRTKVSGGIAIRAARVAGVPVDDLLTGKWPVPGCCPMCGRSSLAK